MPNSTSSTSGGSVLPRRRRSEIALNQYASVAQRIERVAQSSASALLASRLKRRPRWSVCPGQGSSCSPGCSTAWAIMSRWMSARIRVPGAPRGLHVHDSSSGVAGAALHACSTMRDRHLLELGGLVPG